MCTISVKKKFKHRLIKQFRSHRESFILGSVLTDLIQQPLAYFLCLYSSQSAQLFPCVLYVALPMGFGIMIAIVTTVNHYESQQNIRDEQIACLYLTVCFIWGIIYCGYYIGQQMNSIELWMLIQFSIIIFLF